MATEKVLVEQNSNYSKMNELIKDDNRCHIKCDKIKAQDLTKAVLQKMVAMTEFLMKDYYDKSKYLGPWNEKKLTEELVHKDSKFIIIWNANKTELIGYICYRLERVDNTDDDMKYHEFYIYEIMINDKHQRKGYGQYLMNECVSIAKLNECDYLAITVFSCNKSAIKFYIDKIGFEYAPNESDEYVNDHRILVKYL